MRILVDENIPRRTVRQLREEGHEVIDYRSSSDEGMSDDEIWERCQRLQALLLTTDKGFARFRGQRHCGVLIICLRQPNLTRIHNRVVQVLQRFRQEEWQNAVVIARDTVLQRWA